MGDNEGWTEDVLGAGFNARTLRLPGLSGQEFAEATLVHYTPDEVEITTMRPPILYIHGFNDYFFQRHLAEAMTRQGYPFYAIDLRGHGRSLDAWIAHGGDANLVNDLNLYQEDLDAAAEIIAADGHTGLVLMGHSTGGLIGPLYANVRPHKVTALVLNSPWFDLKGSWLDRTLVTYMIYALGRITPRLVVSKQGEDYGRALHRETGGEWDYNLHWKVPGTFPVRAGWVSAIRRAHREVGRGLSVRCPVLVCTSDRTGPDSGKPEVMLSTDAILDIAHMHTRAPKLGKAVDISIIEGGAHDLALSPRPVRDVYLATVVDWLDANV